MVRGARVAYAVLAWAFVAALVVQVFLIGLGLFDGSEYRAVHRDVGWLLHIAPLLPLAVSPFARAGRRLILTTVGLAILTWWVPILAVFRTEMPVAAALHPVAALLTFWLAIHVARAATGLARSSDPGTATTRGGWLVVAVVVVVLLFLSFSGSPT